MFKTNEFIANGFRFSSDGLIDGINNNSVVVYLSIAMSQKFIIDHC